jgi:hypothetical protein
MELRGSGCQVCSVNSKVPHDKDNQPSIWEIETSVYLMSMALSYLIVEVTLPLRFSHYFDFLCVIQSTKMTGHWVCVFS